MSCGQKSALLSHTLLIATNLLRKPSSSEHQFLVAASRTLFIAAASRTLLVFAFLVFTTVTLFHLFRLFPIILSLIIIRSSIAHAFIARATIARASITRHSSMDFLTILSTHQQFASRVLDYLPKNYDQEAHGTLLLLHVHCLVVHHLFSHHW